MNDLRFSIPGEPQGKGRPRARVIRPRAGGSGFVQMYTPSSTRDYEAKVRDCCALAVNRLGWTFEKTDRFGLHVKVYRQYLDKGSDLDNYVKSVGDAINKVAFHDDRQVRQISAVLLRDAGNPRVDVVVSRLDGHDKQGGSPDQSK